MSFSKKVRELKSLIFQYSRGVLLLPLNFLQWFCLVYSRSLAKITGTRPNFWLERQSRKNDLVTKKISHRNSSGEYRLTLFTPNWLCWDRARTFSSKEPGTLAWIDEFGGKGAMFDIGANIGLYSLYHAKTKPGNVYAFEPSPFSLQLLVKNINVNQLTSKIQIVPTPLSALCGIDNFLMSSIELGGAQSAFGVDYGEDGLPLLNKCMFKVLGLSLDMLIRSGLIGEIPSLIKLDVDGIEHLVLKGAEKTLQHPDCRTVLVEVSRSVHSQRSGVAEILSAAGFALQSDSPAKQILGDSSRNINQIWVKG